MFFFLESTHIVIFLTPSKKVTVGFQREEVERVTKGEHVICLFSSLKLKTKSESDRTCLLAFYIHHR